MKFFSIALLLISFHVSANNQSGVAVQILPDKLLLSKSCVARAALQAKEFSILYSCTDSKRRMYFYNFRLNNVDLVADFQKNQKDVVVNKSQFNSYTLYELTAKNSDDKPMKFVSYCTKSLCLDLVSDNEFDSSVQDYITSQLRG